MPPDFFESGAKGAQFQRAITDRSASAFRRYQQLVVGKHAIPKLVKYEAIISVCGGMPGALGLLMRKLFFPKLVASCGKGVIWGRNMVIRHGHKIRIGDDVIFDDNVVLDAKGATNKGITIADRAMISRNTILSCKNGDIRIGADSSVGINCLIHAEEGSHVHIGDQNLIAAYVYFVGGGTYPLDETDTAMKELGTYSRGGITLDRDVWIGANVQILDGVDIEKGAVVAAGAVVTRRVAANTVVGGTPAKKLRQR